MRLLPALVLVFSQEPDVIHVGEIVKAEIPADGTIFHSPVVDKLKLEQPLHGVSLALEVKEKQLVSLELHSHFFDAYLILRRSTGEVIAEDDDGLWNSHARIVQELEQGIYAVEVCTLKPDHGGFRLTTAAGGSAPVQGQELLRARLADYLEAARVLAQKHGDDSLPVADKINRASLLHYHLGNYEKAVELGAQALSIRQQRCPANDPLVIESLGNLAALQSVAGNLQQALDSMADLIARIRLMPGDRSSILASNLNNMGLIAQRLDRYEESIAALNEAVQIRETKIRDQPLALAICLNNLALSQFYLGQMDEAEATYAKSISLLEDQVDAQHPELANTLSNLAGLLKRKGEYRRAQAAAEQALSIREAVLGPNHLHTASTLEELASILRHRAQYTEARKLFERVLEIKVQALPAGHPDIAQTWNNLGVQLTDQGDLEGAQDCYRRALAILGESLGPNHTRYADAQANLGRLLRRLGRFGEARQSLDEALQTLLQHLPKDHPNVIHCQVSLGVLMLDQGDYEAAERAMRETIELCRASGFAQHSFHADALSALEQVLRRSGREEEALEICKEVLKVWRDLVGEDHPSYAIALNNLAVVYRQVGKAEEAQELLHRVHGIWATAYGELHPDTAQACYNLGSLYFDRKKWEDALSWLRLAQTTQEKILGLNHPDSVDTLNLLSRTQWKMGEQEAARSGVLDCVERMSAYLNLNLPQLSEAERFRLLDHLNDCVGGVLLLADGAPDGYRRQAAEALLHWKGWAGEIALQGRQRLRQNQSPERLAMLAELRAINAKLASSTRNRGVVGTQLNLLTQRREELERQLAVDSPATIPSGSSYPSVVACLADDEAIMDFIVLPSSRDSRVQLWLTTAEDTAPRVFDLGARSELEAVVDGFRKAIYGTRGGRALAKDGQRSASAYRLLFSPVESQLENVNRIFISLDSFLGGVPFETLQNKEGMFLIERYSFVYLQKLSALPGITAGRKEISNSSESEPSLLAVGGVNYGTPNFDGGESSNRSNGNDSVYWAPLPFTGSEAREITALHEAKFSTKAARLLLTDVEASEQRLQSEMPNYEVLHLATHGFFRPSGLPSMWELVPSAGGMANYQMAPEFHYLVARMPGLLSGLVLGNANEQGAAANDDGYLTAAEVMWMDLASARLVVLSACESGLGEPRIGEGMLGLQRAFHLAGVKTVVSSLWEINDPATNKLMRDFYINLWHKGMNVGEALRQAQLATLRKNRLELQGRTLPYIWGAFVLSGDWR